MLVATIRRQHQEYAARRELGRLDDAGLLGRTLVPILAADDPRRARVLAGLAEDLFERHGRTVRQQDLADAFELAARAEATALGLHEGDQVWLRPQAGVEPVRA